MVNFKINNRELSAAKGTTTEITVERVAAEISMVSRLRNRLPT